MTDGYLGPKQHALALGFLVFGGVLLAFIPNAVLALQYQCLLHRTTGLHCPFCGMTRDFILMAHGSLPHNNPGSLIVAVGLYVAYPIWLVIAMWRRPSWLLVRRAKIVTVLAIAMGVLFVCNNVVA